MVKEKVTLEDIKTWLETGTEDPDTFVDLAWTLIKELREDDKVVGYKFSHYKIPLNLLVLDLESADEKTKAIRLVVETGIKTIDMDKSSKLSLYRALLELNKQAYIKIYLFGPEDEVAVAADLDKKYLSKEEFEHNLAYVLATVSILAGHEPLAKYIAEETAETLKQLVAAWYRQGVPEEEARRRLEAAGMDKNMIDFFISFIYKNEKKGDLVDILFT